MAPVERLSVADLEAIVAFVREQQRILGFEPYPPGWRTRRLASDRPRAVPQERAICGEPARTPQIAT